MQITRRRLVPGDLDHELIWLSVSLGSLCLAATWFKLGLPWPPCVFHDLTGLPCLTCGATRSVIQLLHGRFAASLRWNPLVFMTVCGLSVFDTYAVAVLVTRSPRLRIAHFTSAEKIFVRALVPILLAMNWIYLLAHWRSY